MLLHDAIDETLRSSPGAMSSRDIADEINRRGSYVRSDGQPIETKQVSARVRRPEYRQRYVIDDEFRIALTGE